MRRTLVLICDDHPLMSHGLRALLKPNFVVVGVVNDGREVIDQIEQPRATPKIIDQPGKDTSANRHMQFRRMLLDQSAQRKTGNNLRGRGNRDTDQIGAISQNGRQAGFQQGSESDLSPERQNFG